MITTRTAWVHNKILSYVKKESKRTYPYETGGVFMGYWVKPSQEVVINGVIGPGPNAKHRLFHFEPDYEWQERAIANIYIESGRYATYLGDWHSHPKGSTKLSIKDHITLWQIGHFENARISTPVMGIFAGRKDEFRICYQEKIIFFRGFHIPVTKNIIIRFYYDKQYFIIP